MNTDEPKPAAEATKPKTETTAPVPDPKAVELTHETSAEKSTPSANAETKTGIKPDVKPMAVNKSKS